MTTRTLATIDGTYGKKPPTQDTRETLLQLMDVPFSGGASFRPVILQRNGCSYFFTGPQHHALAQFLIDNNYDLESNHSPHEWGRLRYHGAVITIYQNGTVFPQGQTEPSATLLASLVDEGMAF